MADHFDSKTGADQNTPNTPARHRRVDRHKQLYQDIQRESENQPAAQDTDAGLFGGSSKCIDIHIRLWMIDHSFSRYIHILRKQGTVV